MTSETAPLLKHEESKVRFTRKDEETAEIERTAEVDPMLGETKIPIDRHHFVYLIILLHGIGTLLPWNMFINIAPSYYMYFKIMEKNEAEDLVSTPLSENFLSYMSLAFLVPNLLLNLINVFIPVKGDLTKRICTALSIVGMIIIFTMSFIYTWSWRIAFTVLTLVTIAILNSANGIYLNSVFGMAADLPFKYTNAVIIGNNLCGTFVALVNIFAFSVTPDVREAALLYFSMALACLIICFISLFTLRKLPYYIYYKEQGALAAKSDHIETKVTMQNYIDTFKQGWCMFLNVFLVFFVTLTCFPGLMVAVSDAGYGQTYKFPISENLFVSITCFLLFNVFAFIGSLLASKLQMPANKLWIAVYARIVFIPFFFFCNCHVATRRWPVFFPSTYFYVFMAILMSISSGYLSGLGMMYAPSSVDASKQRIAGMMAGFFFILGIVLGLAFNNAVLFVLTNLGPLAPYHSL